jgi:hypothetical protein
MRSSTAARAKLACRAAASNACRPFSDGKNVGMAANVRCISVMRKGTTRRLPRALGSPSSTGGSTRERGMNVAIFGAGLMGHALALVYALAGHTIRMTDNDPEMLARSLGRMQVVLATLRDGGEADASWTDARLAAAVTRCKTVAETGGGGTGRGGDHRTAGRQARAVRGDRCVGAD